MQRGDCLVASSGCQVTDTVLNTKLLEQKESSFNNNGSGDFDPFRVP